MVQEMKRRQRDEQDRRVYAFVGVSEGRLCINISWYYLEGDAHWNFLDDMFTAGGFTAPRAIVFEKNKQRDDGSWGVNWNELRVSREQCEMARRTPERAAREIREWLDGDVPKDRYSLNIEVGEHTEF